MFKKFNQHIDEIGAYIQDPLTEGDYIWSKTLKIHDIAIVKVVAYITGVDRNHTAEISVITKSIDTIGEELAKERLIIHQKDFNNREDATKHLIEKEKETTFK